MCLTGCAAVILFDAPVYTDVRLRDTVRDGLGPAYEVITWFLHAVEGVIAMIGGSQGSMVVLFSVCFCIYSGHQGELRAAHMIYPTFQETPCLLC